MTEFKDIYYRPAKIADYLNLNTNFFKSLLGFSDSDDDDDDFKFSNNNFSNNNEMRLIYKLNDFKLEDISLGQSNHVISVYASNIEKDVFQDQKVYQHEIDIIDASFDGTFLRITFKKKSDLYRKIKITSIENNKGKLQ